MNHADCTALQGLADDYLAGTLSEWQARRFNQLVAKLAISLTSTPTLTWRFVLAQAAVRQAERAVEAANQRLAAAGAELELDATARAARNARAQ